MARLFIAINLPLPERRAIREATAAMRAAGGHVTWVAEENLHLTLKFLGEQPLEALNALSQSLAGVAERCRPLTLELGGVGAFPSLRAPRVVWLGVARDPKLELLHHDVEVACATLGYEVDGRAFRPHITLGRVRARPERDAARALAAAAGLVRHRGVVEARSVDLMSSVLSPRGARYDVLAALPLGGRRS